MTYQGPERRASERTGELSEAEVRKAAIRLIDSEVDFDAGEFTEGELMRKRMAELMMSHLSPRQEPGVERSQEIISRLDHWILELELQVRLVGEDGQALVYPELRQEGSEESRMVITRIAEDLQNTFHQGEPRGALEDAMTEMEDDEYDYRSVAKMMKSNSPSPQRSVMALLEAGYTLGLRAYCQMKKRELMEQVAHMENPKTTEQMTTFELTKTLKAKAFEAFEGLARDGLINEDRSPKMEGDAKMPGWFEIVQFLLETLTPKQIEILTDKKFVADLGIKIVPITSSSQTIKHGSRFPRIRKNGVGWTNESRLAKDTKNGHINADGETTHNITSWQIWLGEAARAPIELPNEDVYSSISERQAWLGRVFYDYQDMGGITLEAYMRLLSDSKAKGEAIDNDEDGLDCTILGGEDCFDFSEGMTPETSTFLPFAFWDEKQAEDVLLWDRVDQSSSGARQRLSLILTMPNITSNT
jgi:hypothetical protein